MIRGFFFDLDGTLVDTHEANYEAYRHALSDFGINLSREQFMTSIGHQAKTFLPWFAPSLSGDDYEHIANLKIKYYKQNMHLTALNVKLVRFLESMKPEHTIVLVTTAKCVSALSVLRHHGIDKYFDLVITAEDVRTSKPSPECYYLALEKTGLDKHEALVFEDSEPGVAAAEAAGIAVVMISRFSDDTA